MSPVLWAVDSRPEKEGIVFCPPKGCLLFKGSALFALGQNKGHFRHLSSQDNYSLLHKEHLLTKETWMDMKNKTSELLLFFEFARM